MIVANIVADVIIDLAKDVPLYLNENGVFIAWDYKDRKLSVIEALEKTVLTLLSNLRKANRLRDISSGPHRQLMGDIFMPRVFISRGIGHMYRFQVMTHHIIPFALSARMN